MGLDKPLIEQYCNWIGNIVFHGDFGDSLISNEPVSDMMWSKFWKHLLILAFCGILIAVLIGIPLGNDICN